MSFIRKHKIVLLTFFLTFLSIYIALFPINFDNGFTKNSPEILTAGQVPDKSPCEDEDNTDMLHYDNYRESCPSAEKIIANAIRELQLEKSSVAPSLIRLLFHDFFVEGCDASILLDSDEAIASEKEAAPNLTLKGFDVIEEIKSELENICPGVVSCADILVLAARKAVLMAGGPFYPLETGRKDSPAAYKQHAHEELLSPNANLSDILASFAIREFNARETVSLFGAHSIGIMHCSFFEDRLYNYAGTGKPDPRLNPKFREQLKPKCPFSGSAVSPPPPHEAELEPSLAASDYSDSYFSTSSGKNKDGVVDLSYNNEGGDGNFGTRYFKRLMQKEASRNQSLKGFDVKNMCPGVVPCDDFLALATRVAFVETGGPGCKDIAVAYKDIAQRELPLPQDNLSMVFNMRETIRTSTFVSSTLHLKNGAVNRDPDQPVRIKLRNYRSVIYYGDISVGDQKFVVVFDTGSSYLWIPSDKWPECEYDHAMYNPEDSKTYKENGEEIRLEYGSGNLKGILAKDDVRVGDLLLEQQDFAMGSEPNDELQEVAFDGILGLNIPPKVTSGTTTTVWQNMVRRNLVNTHIFSIWLKAHHGNEVDEDPDGGEIMFGGVDPKHFTEEHTFVNQLKGPRDFWKFRMTTILVGEKLRLCTTGSGCTAIVDSGLTDISGPKSEITKINKVIGTEADGKTLPCSRRGNLPDISFTIGGKLFPLTPNEYIAEDSDECFTRFVVNFINGNWMLGQAFMRPYHTVFDYEDANKPRIGFAKASED